MIAKRNFWGKTGLLAGLGALVAFQASAVTDYQYLFRYSDNGLIGAGSLTVAVNSGSAQVLGGTFDVTASPVAGYTGVYSLLNPGGSGSIFTSFAVNYDNLLLNQTGLPNASYSQTGLGGTTLLTAINNGGIAFTGGGQDIEIFSANGGPGLGFAMGQVGGSLPALTSTFPGTGSFTITPVPEAGAFAIASAGVLGFAFLGRRLLKSTTL